MEFDSNMLKRLLDHINVAVFVLDKDGRYLYVNRAYTQIIRRDEEYVLGSTIPGLKSQGFLHQTTLEDVLRRKETVHSVITVTDTEQHRVYKVLNSAFPYTDAEGEIQYIFYIQETLPDISARLQMGLSNQKAVFEGYQRTSKSTVNIVKESPQMAALCSMLSTVAKTDASVLIYGPSGSGKEVLANYVHQNSLRKDAPFLVLNCASIPENLMESELFGYEKGAFTGAMPGGKMGLIEAANGGSLFLDEINSMPYSLQTKLLRVLETKQVTRVGSVRSKKINFRLICASNEDFQTLIREHRFRQDLYYRINVVSVNIPPLCQRKEDILPLASHFLKYYCEKYSCVKVFSEQSIQRMEAYAWPGNVRELRNFVERMVVTSSLHEFELIEVPEDLSCQGLPPADAPDAGPSALPKRNIYDSGFSFKSYMNQCERELLQDALEQFGTPAAVAEKLKIDLSNVYRKLQKHHLTAGRREQDSQGGARS